MLNAVTKQTQTDTDTDADADTGTGTDTRTQTHTQIPVGTILLSALSRARYMSCGPVSVGLFWASQGSYIELFWVSQGSYIGLFWHAYLRPGERCHREGEPGGADSTQAAHHS